MKSYIRPIQNMSLASAEKKAIEEWYEAFLAAIEDDATYEEAVKAAEQARDSFLSDYWSYDNANDL